MTDTQTLNLRPPVWALLGAVVIAGLFFVYGKSMENKDRTPATINVSGDGRVFATPDIAEMSFGVQTGRRASAKEAIDALKRSMDAVYAAVKEAGVPEKDIQNQQFSLSPEYSWTNNRQTIIGYAGSQMLRVKVRDLDKVSGVLAAATEAGANQAGDVQFTIDDPQKLRDQARDEAIEEAQENAKALAKQLGVSLGELKGFSEGGGYTPPMPYYGRMGGGTAVAEDAAMNQSVPLPAGEQEITVQVNLTYEVD